MPIFDDDMMGQYSTRFFVNHTSPGQSATNTTGLSNQGCETMCQLGHIIILKRCPGSKFSGHPDGSLRQPSWPIVWISDSYPSSTKHADISNEELCCSFKAMFSGGEFDFIASPALVSAYVFLFQVLILHSLRYSNMVWLSEPCHGATNSSLRHTVWTAAVASSPLTDQRKSSTVAKLTARGEGKASLKPTLPQPSNHNKIDQVMVICYEIFMEHQWLMEYI